MTIRSATASDAEAIAAIFNQGIAERVATFETHPQCAGWWRRGSRRASSCW